MSDNRYTVGRPSTVVMRRRTFLAVSTAGIVTLAGCASDGTDDGTTTTAGDGATTTTTAGNGTTTEQPTTTAGNGTTTDGTAGDVTVAVRTVEPYGDILVDDEGMTLYLFTRDEDGESVCYDDCADAWPPLVVEGEPTAGDGVTAELATTERRDGSMQVTAGGWPLYYFTPDERPGDANGQAVGGVWYVLAPDGSMIETPPPDEGGNGSDGSNAS